MLNAGGHACAVIAMFQVGGGSFTHVIKASEPVVSVILGLLINGAVPKPLTAVSLLPITYGVAYASTLGQLDVQTMSKELGTLAAKWVVHYHQKKFHFDLLNDIISNRENNMTQKMS